MHDLLLTDSELERLFLPIVQRVGLSKQQARDVLRDPRRCVDSELSRAPLDGAQNL